MTTIERIHECIKNNSGNKECLIEAASEIESLTKERDDLKERLQVSEQIGDSFWAALKGLKLTSINVQNPGQHITDLHQERNKLRAALDNRNDVEGKAHALFTSALSDGTRVMHTPDTCNPLGFVQLLRARINKELAYRTKMCEALESTRHVLTAQSVSGQDAHAHYVLMAGRLLKEQIEPALRQSSIKAVDTASNPAQSF